MSSLRSFGSIAFSSMYNVYTVYTTCTSASYWPDHSFNRVTPSSHLHWSSPLIPVYKADTQRTQREYNEHQCLGTTSNIISYEYGTLESVECPSHITILSVIASVCHTHFIPNGQFTVMNFFEYFVLMYSVHFVIFHFIYLYAVFVVLTTGDKANERIKQST